jgi:hypothetical protein
MMIWKHRVDSTSEIWIVHLLVPEHSFVTAFLRMIDHNIIGCSANCAVTIRLKRSKKNEERFPPLLATAHWRTLEGIVRTRLFYCRRALLGLGIASFPERLHIARTHTLGAPIHYRAYLFFCHIYHPT